MKRFATIVALVLLIIAVLICAVACGDNDFPKEYIVTIHQGEGLADIEWNVNDELPTLFKEGYYVEGYYFDKDFTSEASLATLKVTGITKNVDVYVKWQKNACTHNVVTDHAVLPTCTTTGLTEGSHCSICNEVFIAQQEIAALGHDYSSEWTIDVAATCTTDGSKSHHCKLCGDKKDISVMVAEGHKGGEATCTEKARCDVCGKEYGDFGEHCAVVDDAILPTCTENGLTEGSHCIVCDKVFIAQQTVLALGHDFISRITRMPTTEKQGAKLLRCKTCGWKKTELLPTLEGARVVYLTYDMFGIIPDEYSTAGMWIWKNIDKTAELENYFLEHGYETSGRSTSSQAMKQNLTRIEYRESNNDFSVQYFDGNGNCTSVVYHNKSNEVPDFAEIFADIEPNDDFRSTKTFIAWGWECVNNQFVDDLKAKFENAGYILAEEQEDQAFENVNVQVLFGTDNGKPCYGIIVLPNEEGNLSTVQYNYSVPSDKEALFLEKDDFANADYFIAESDNPISLSYYIDDDARLDFVYALAKAGFCVDSENVADMEGSKSTTFTLFSESGGYYFFLSYFDGSGKAWQMTFKKNITVYIEARTFSIKYVASEGGQIIGEADQSVQQSQTTQTVKAVAHNGYIFVEWSDGVKTAERSDIAREDMTVTALFEKRNDTILPNGLYIGSGFSEETDVMFFKVDGYEIFVLDDNGNKTDVFYLIRQSNDYTIEIIVGEKTYALLQYSKTVYADENMALYRLFEANIITSFDADKVGIYGDRENNATVTVSADGKITAFGETQNVVKIDGVYVGCVSLSEAGVPDVPDYYKKYYFSEGAIDISFGQDNSVICSYIEGKYKFYKEAQTLPQGSGSRISAPSGSVGKYKMAVTDRSIEIKEDGTVIITEQGTSSEWHLYESEDTISIIAQRVDSNIELLIEFDGNNVVVYEANQYYKAGMIYRRI